jgi:hypothetical protein
MQTSHYRNGPDECAGHPKNQERSKDNQQRSQLVLWNPDLPNGQVNQCREKKQHAGGFEN